MTAPPRVGVVIPHWGPTGPLLRCLRSLNGMRDILVVNNDRPARLKALRSLFPEVSIAQNPENLGFARACNQGLEALFARDCPYVLLMNNDAVADPMFLAPLLLALGKHPRMAAASPTVLRHPGAEQEYPIPLDAPGRLTQLKEPSSSGFWEVTSLTGACMLVRREAFEDVGPLDAGFFMYCEELDWGIRARKKGWLLGHVPASAVWHQSFREPAKRRRLARIAYQRSRSILRLTERHPGWAGRRYLFRELVGDLRRFGVKRLFPRYAAAIRRGVADHRRGR